jgi:type II secretory pathway pseudopilin PulG
MKARRALGFTLVELTVSIVLAAVVTGFIAMFLATPVSAYLAQGRRAELSDGAEAAKRMMRADIEAALPNSVRTATVGTRRIVEMIKVDAMTTYRDIGAGDDVLNINAVDTSFDVLQPIALGPASRLVVNNTRAANRSAYTAANSVITPAGVATGSGLPNISLNPGFRFPLASPNRRVYAVTTAIQYQCDLTTRTLLRFDNVPIAAAVDVNAGGTIGHVVARDVTACTFPQPSAGTRWNGGVASFDITISRLTNGATDRLRLMHQVAVRNPS